MRPRFGDGYSERTDGERLPMSHYKANVRDLEFNLFEVLAFLPDLNKYIRDNFFR